VLLLDPVVPGNLDEDGYVIGSPITPEPGMMRMFAGGRVRTISPLALNSETSRTTKVASITDKEGRRGLLHFVTMRSTWSQGGRECLVDEQDYVFMPTRSAGPSPEGLLVTFSALTANPYRIHWDRDFCRRAGHDGLVIHGPLQALLMAQAFADTGADFTGKRFSYRFRAAVTAPTRLTVGIEEDEAKVRRPDGTVTATATLG